MNNKWSIPASITLKTDGSYDVKSPDGNDGGGDGIFILPAALLFLSFPAWYAYLLVCNLTNIGVWRDFGPEQYWQNVSGFYEGEVCHAFLPDWLDDGRYPDQALFVSQLPENGLRITTSGIEAKDLMHAIEYKNHIMKEIPYLLVDTKKPLFMKYRGAIERGYLINGDKFKSKEFSSDWTAITIYGDQDKSVHGYLRILPSNVSPGMEGIDTFDIDKEYVLNIRDNRTLIELLGAEDKFGPDSDEDARYAIILGDNCKPKVIERDI